MIYTIVIIVIILIAVVGIIIQLCTSSTSEGFLPTPVSPDSIYGQYFNPYFVPPSTCMETLFGTIECYKMPKEIWSNDWWIGH